MDATFTKLLRIAFQPGELEYLNSLPEFSALVSDAVPEDLENVCKAGERLLEARIWARSACGDG